MPSRQLRRHAARKRGDAKENVVERKRSTQPWLYAFSVVILVIIVVTFIGLPTVGSPGAAGRIEFGSYRGVPIEYVPGNFLAERVNVLADQLREESRGDQSEAELEMQGYRVWRSAFEQTVLHTAILYEAEQGGLWVSDDKVDETLLTSGPYVVGGRFSEERYRNTASAERYTIRKLFREQLIYEQYVTDFFQNPLQSPTQREFFAQMMDEQRRFTVVSFPFNDYPEQEVSRFAENNRELFRRIRLSRILIKAGAREATEVRSKLEERTASFEEMARAQSKDAYAEMGGDMGWRYFYDLTGDFETTEPVETIFALQEGSLSPVLESRFGWVIYRADSQALELDLGDPDALARVREYILRYERGMVEDYAAQQAQRFLDRVGQVSFTGATLEQTYRTGMTDYFPLNYQEVYFLAPVRSLNPDLNLSAASYTESFFREGFALAVGEVSRPVVLDDQVVVLRLDDIRRPPERQLDLMDDYYNFYAAQGREADLQSILLDPKYLTDNFNETFYQYIFTSR